MKKFLITIDTEGDNLWTWKEGMPICTNNTKYLQRFQQLCESFEYKPVWLTNFEMINDDKYVEFISKVEEKNTGEIGMHLHAWNSPPEYPLPIENIGAPYLIEYPREIMEEKIKYLTDLIFSRTGIKPTSHRAGRWATNQDYFDLLMKYGYNIDCSVTPHIDWSLAPGRKKNSFGTNYLAFPEDSYYINSSDKSMRMLELPVTIMHKTAFILPDSFKIKNIVKSAVHVVKPWNLWIRPNGRNLNQMKYVVNNSTSEYIMFMLHSSELMPGGSPTFRDDASIEKLYSDILNLFKLVKNNYEGCTLREFEQLKREKI